MLRKCVLGFGLVLLFVGLGLGLTAPERAEAGCVTSINCEKCELRAGQIQAICEPVFANGHCTCTDVASGCIAYGSCIFVENPPI